MPKIHAHHFPQLLHYKPQHKQHKLNSRASSPEQPLEGNEERFARIADYLEVRVNKFSDLPEVDQEFWNKEMARQENFQSSSPTASNTDSLVEALNKEAQRQIEKDDD